VLLFAHAGHYLWVLYLIPVVIVLASIVNSILRERRRDGSDAREAADAEDREETGQRQADARP
jgi:cytochrome c-type biogenesis protein CcmH/NrfF